MTMSKVEVTQTDREAAAQLADQIQEWDIAKNIREGKRDPYVWCQAFARHREQAAAEERAKIIEAVRDRMAELTAAIQKEWGAGSQQHYIGRDFMDLIIKGEL